MQKTDLKRGDVMLMHGLYKGAHYLIAALQAAVLARSGKVAWKESPIGSHYFALENIQ